LQFGKFLQPRNLLSLYLPSFLDILTTISPPQSGHLGGVSSISVVGFDFV
jgi:hypothetical protein